LVADNLSEEQNAQGFAIQSLFIGLGGTVASALPWMMTNWFGVTSEGAGQGHIPNSVRLSFYIGAAAFMGAVLWTVFTTSEYPPSESELAAIRIRKFDWTLGLGDIFALVFHLPRRMWELGLVQFFTWVGMFSMWVYFSPAVAKNIFHAAPGSVEMEASVSWSGFCFAAYNAVCFIFSFVLLWSTKYTGPKLMHILCLAVGALGLASVPLASDKHHLLIAMTAVGIAWASILSMPYARLHLETLSAQRTHECPRPGWCEHGTGRSADAVGGDLQENRRRSYCARHGQHALNRHWIHNATGESNDNVRFPAAN
jgi:maltose/moltooligosaccharide transporter